MKKINSYISEKLVISKNRKEDIELSKLSNTLIKQIGNLLSDSPFFSKISDDLMHAIYNWAYKYNIENFQIFVANMMFNFFRGWIDSFHMTGLPDKKITDKLNGIDGVNDDKKYNYLYKNGDIYLKYIMNENIFYIDSDRYEIILEKTS